MYKSAGILILLFFFSLLISQVLQWPEWPAWPDWEKKLRTQGDTSPPDTFTTAPVLAFTAPNVMVLSWNPSEINARDVETLRLQLTYYGFPNGLYARPYPEHYNPDVQTTNIDIPWSVASVDSDTVLIWTELHYHNPSSSPYTLDTTLTVYVQPILSDTSNNLTTMGKIEETLYINFEPVVPVDSFYFTANNDSILVRFSPSIKTYRNTTWLTETQIDTSITFSIFLRKVSDGSVSHTIISSDRLWQVKDDSTYSYDVAFTSGESYYLTSYWVLNTDLLDDFSWNISCTDTNARVISDTITFLGIPTLVLDTLGNGQDTTYATASGWDTTTTNFWVGWDDTLRSSAGDTSSCDSLHYYAVGDTGSTFKWNHPLANDGYVYCLIVVTDGVKQSVVYDSLYIPDVFAPTAGEITLNGILQYNDIDISLKYGGNADFAEAVLAIRPDTSQSFVTVKIYGDTSIARDTVDIYNVSQDAQNHVMVLRWTIQDDDSLTAVSYDILDYTALTRFFTVAVDTGDTTLSLASGLRLYCSADSNSTLLDSFFVDSADFDITEQANDSVFAYLDTLNWNGDTLWFAGKYIYGDSLGGTGIWYQYPQPGAGGAETLKDSVMVFLPFDNTTIEDSSDNSYTIAEFGTGSEVLLTDTKQVGDSSLSTTGWASCVTMTDGAGSDFNFSSDPGITVLFWFQLGANDASRSLIGQRQSTSGAWWFLNHEWNGLFLSWDDGSNESAPATITSALTINTWYHCALSFDTDSVRLDVSSTTTFQDVVDTSFAYDTGNFPTVTFDSLWVGFSGDDSTPQNANRLGKTDHFMVFDHRKLTEAEKQDHYDGDM